MTAVKYVAYGWLALSAASFTFLLCACLSRWSWLRGFAVDDDLAAGEPDDDTSPDTVGELIDRINARRAARGKPPLERAELDAALQQIQVELDHVDGNRWRS